MYITQVYELNWSDNEFCIDHTTVLIIIYNIYYNLPWFTLTVIECVRILYEFYFIIVFHDRYFVNDRKYRVKNITQYLKNDRDQVDVLLIVLYTYYSSLYWYNGRP